MTRNQKIALGCGGAGCLGLIVVAIASTLIYFFLYNQSRRDTFDNDNFNVSTNRNSNSNTNDNSDLSADTNDNSNSSDDSSAAASSLSEDDQHKLYQAAAMSGDQLLINRVNIKLGLMDEDNMPSPELRPFLAAHAAWAMSNLAFIGSLDTPEKARAYVEENIPD